MPVAEGFQLAHFAYLLEAALGINLAYGTLGPIHDAGWRDFVEHKRVHWDELEKKIAAEPRDQNFLRVALDKLLKPSWDEEENRHRTSSLKYVKAANVISFIFTFVILSLLALIGFDHETKINIWYISGILWISVLPILSHLRLRWFWDQKKKDFTKRFSLTTLAMKEFALDLNKRNKGKTKGSLNKIKRRSPAQALR